MKLPAKRVIDRSDKFGRFMLHCFAIIGEIPEVTKKVEKEVTGAPGGQIYDVQLMINGIEVPIEEIILSWLQRCDEEVSHEAASMIKSNLDSLKEEITEVKEEITEALEKAMVKAAQRLGRVYDPYEDSIS